MGKKRAEKKVEKGLTRVSMSWNGKGANNFLLELGITAGRGLTHADS